MRVNEGPHTTARRTLRRGGKAWSHMEGTKEHKVEGIFHAKDVERAEVES
jgi:hypothetical protein